MPGDAVTILAEGVPPRGLAATRWEAEADMDEKCAGEYRHRGLEVQGVPRGFFLGLASDW